MTQAWMWSLASVTLVSLVSLVGLLTLTLDTRSLRRLAMRLVSFATGALLGDAFIHLLPETFRTTQNPLRSSWLVLLGLLLFFVVEKLIRHRHGHIHHHPEPTSGSGVRHELWVVNVLGDAIHNFIDGLLMGASYLVSPALGLSTTVAVLLHEIPQELGDFGILLHSGLGVRRAALVNLGTASVAVLGTLTALLGGTALGDRLPDILVPLTAGGFVYLATATLIPELQHDRSFRALVEQSALIALGLLVMSLLTWVK